MAQASTDTGGMDVTGAFSWSGSLQTTNIRQLYERCQKLRLTGLMVLRQGSDALELTWLGGEPIENEGDQGTRSLPLWNTGEFKVEQRIPDWKGRLTSSVEVSGPLKAGQIQAIYKLCSDHLLSAEVELKRQSGESAQVRFTLGKAESATISGQTESALSALSKLGGWNDGNFRVALRPMFGDATVAEAPVFRKEGDAQFDVTGSLDLAKGNVQWPPKPREPAPAAPAAASGVRPASGPSPAPAPAAPAAPASAATPSANASARLAQTLITPQKAPSAAQIAAASTAATQPLSVVTKQQLAQQEKQRSLGRILIVGSIAIIALCAAVIAALMYLKK